MGYNEQDKHNPGIAIADINKVSRVTLTRFEEGALGKLSGSGKLDAWDESWTDEAVLEGESDDVSLSLILLMEKAIQ